MRFETGDRKANKADEFTLTAQFGGVQAEAVLPEVILNAINDEIALNSREA